MNAQFSSFSLNVIIITFSATQENCAQFSCISNVRLHLFWSQTNILRLPIFTVNKVIRGGVQKRVFSDYHEKETDKNTMRDRETERQSARMQQRYTYMIDYVLIKLSVTREQELKTT